MIFLVLALSIGAVGWSVRLIASDGYGSVAPPRSHMHETDVVCTRNVQVVNR